MIPAVKKSDALLTFHELAWRRVSRGKRFLQWLARHRCETDNYRWPVEMLFNRWLVPVQKLS
jgi:hypothetical protein